MIKQAPTPGRIAAMVVFALSCFGILLYLWLAFGGSIPLRPESYRFEVAIPEAPTLSREADVRIAGVDVGKVKTRELDVDGASTVVEVELESRYAPTGRDARVTLRQKTLLGESYLELAPGLPSSDELPDGARLPDAQVEPSVELDEIANAFDARTRRAFGDAAGELAAGLRSGRARDLNAAFGNLAGFATDADALAAVLDREGLSLQRLIANGGVVFDALSERRGALRGLIVGAGDSFGALASQDEALAETVRIMPTFLDEARVTTARIERSLLRAAPLVHDLGPAARDLRPTLRDLADLSPDLERTFRRLDPLIAASRPGLPALERVVRGAGPVVEAVHPFAAELNPIAALLSYFQVRVAGFLANGGPVVAYNIGGEHAAANTALLDPRSFEQIEARPEHDRGNAYLQPNFPERLISIGGYESFDCTRAGPPTNRFGDVRPNDALDTPPPLKVFTRRPPCLVAGASLYDGKLFNIPRRGVAPVKDRPRGTAGELPILGRP